MNKEIESKLLNENFRLKDALSSHQNMVKQMEEQLAEIKVNMVREREERDAS